MINPFHEVNWNPGTQERRKFALALIIGSPAFATLLFVVRRVASGIWRPEPSLWISGVGLGLGLLLFVVPQIARPVYVVWYFVGCSIGIVVANLLFLFLFFGVVTPIGIFRRFSSRRTMRKTFDKSIDTYWQSADEPSDITRYYKQF